MDVDWDDIAAPLPRDGGASDGEHDLAADALALPGAAEALAVTPGERAGPAVERRVRSRLQVPGPQHRSRAEQFLAASRMRDAKAANHLCRSRAATKYSVAEA